MKITGLITEYNPFHNGHLYHIEQAKTLTNADAVIVVMSGNFVQRGEPAIMDKYLRTKAALLAGASLVIELPTLFATGSAEFFASGAISLLHQLGVVDSICFGSEEGTLDKFHLLADLFINETEDYAGHLKEALKKGASFPKARSYAIQQLFGNREITDILNHPNNVLGIEYMKALYRLNSTMTPYTIQRTTDNYHDTAFDSACSSASALRYNLDKQQDLSVIQPYVPDFIYTIYEENYKKNFPVVPNDLSSYLRYKLLFQTKEQFAEYWDINETLANRILNHFSKYDNWDNFCNLLKTKDYTHSRIQRSLLHFLLDMKETAYCNPSFLCPYARVLGFKKDSSWILSSIKENTSIPLITKISNFKNETGPIKDLLNMDRLCADLYQSILSEKYQLPFISEYEKQLIII